MDSPIPTSFIPKRPIVPDSSQYQQHSSRSVGLLSLLAGIVVIATVVSFIGVYIYEKGIAAQRDKLQQELEAARMNIGTDFLTDMKRLTARISGVKQLVQSHVVVSPIFQALELTTLRSVQYKTFAYELRTDAATKTDIVAVKISGIAKNYATIALQSDAFAQASLIKNPVFSNLTVDDKTGGILFELNFDVAIPDLSFQTFIDAKMKANAQIPVIIEAETNGSEFTL